MNQAAVNRGMAAEKLSTSEFWSAFAPDLHLGDRAFLESQAVWPIDEGTGESLKELIRVEGYFQLPPQQWSLPMERMAELIKSLDQNGLPLPFAFVYDEFWCLFVRMHNVLEKLLGAGYLRLPDFWTWLVDPQRSESGWRPHRDKGYMSLNPDGSPRAVTVWIPLTDSTPLNGCMYIIPADRDPTYGTPEDKVWKYAAADVRALPAQAGSILCWNQAVLHWGSHANRREMLPRISLAFEFQSGNITPLNQPVTRPLDIPAVDFRLRLIGKQILQYKHMYPLAPEIEAMAVSLCGDLLPTTV